jgi:hypothetical protein
MFVAWENGLGEEERSPVFAEFTDDSGQQWIVTKSWRWIGRPEFDVLRRETVTFLRD